MPSAEMENLKFLQSEANLCHIWFTSCHVGESAECLSLPLFLIPYACHFRSLAVLGD